MTSAELLTSPPLRSRDEGPVIVVDSSDDEQEGEPTTKRRRTVYDTENSENVIDLTDGGEDRNPEEHIRFRILPKLIRLQPFQFSEFDDEPDGMPLESLREHLRQLFGTTGIIQGEDDPPSPINPDELEITGVKASSIPSSTSSSTSTTTTTTSTNPSSSTKSRGATPTSSTKEKEKEKGKGKDEGVSLECAICLGEMKRTTATTCGHVFCYECIKTAIQVTKCCPMCKKKLTQRSIHPLYL